MTKGLIMNNNYRKSDKQVNRQSEKRSGDFKDNKRFNKNNRNSEREPRSFDEKFEKFEKSDRFDRDNSTDNKPTNEEKNYIIGRNPVIEALKSGKNIDTLYVNKEGGGSLPHIISLAREAGVVVKDVNDQKLSFMSNGASHQGVIAVGAYAEYCSVDDIINIAKEKNEPPFIIVCDEIEDPHNLGAIIRTAECAGAHGIIIPKRRSATLNHTVYKTSAGAASYLPVARVANIPATLEILKKEGVWVYGTDMSGENYTTTNLTGSIALVIGSEGFGMSRLVKDKCDFLVKLPMMGEITSLNASVAGGIFMYEILRQRNIK